MVRKNVKQLVLGITGLMLLCMTLPASAELTAYWSYDSNFSEEIGTVSSVPQANWGGGINALGPGKFSQALVSTAGDSTVGYSAFDVVPAVIDHDSGTFEAWVNRTGTGWQFLMGTGWNGLWTRGVQLYISDPVLGDSYLQAYLEDFTDVDRDWLEPASAAAVVTAGQWNHCALVWDANEVNLYLNGNRIANQVRVSGDWLDGDDNFFIAGANPLGANPLLGSIDDVAIWNEVRYTGATYTVPTGPLGGGQQTCQDILLQGSGLDTDLNNDCNIDMLDLQMVLDDWLRCFDPGNVNCENTWLQRP
jgi:hypothetical protein